jgi:hypothetical protein
MDQTGPAFEYLAEKFPKIKEGVYISPQICPLFRDEQFDCILSGNKNTMWDDFQLVAANF